MTLTIGNVTMIENSAKNNFHEMLKYQWPHHLLFNDELGLPDVDVVKTSF